MLIRSVLGNITFSKAVVSKIISKTVITTAGVAAMSTGLIKGLAQKVTGNSLMSGIELTTDDTGLNISLSIKQHCIKHIPQALEVGRQPVQPPVCL
ncbi:Asp23/Gls24 family envelope stress response protein [Paenibacillus albidus]|uniref:Asp23/Gls24 family envelope stress response protein n=1 Tax=Paenibacillus albidus TaxID=2041023 RepID=UPI001BE52BE1|nr:Asp23/Gls24 family envelope stress response protein [Paenibacillus albidus]MBT2287697.1 Asp23/Gls24 family envelope stress response protein [Paenibacillus albidus]